jgi:hypothetical protein
LSFLVEPNPSGRPFDITLLFDPLWDKVHKKWDKVHVPLSRVSHALSFCDSNVHIEYFPFPGATNAMSEF